MSTSIIWLLRKKQKREKDGPCVDDTIILASGDCHTMTVMFTSIFYYIRFQRLIRGTWGNQMVCLEPYSERSLSKLPETGPNSKMTKSLVVEVVRVTTELS